MNFTDDEIELLRRHLDWSSGTELFNKLWALICTARSSPQPTSQDSSFSERLQILDKLSKIGPSRQRNKVSIEYLDGVFYAIIGGATRGTGENATEAVNEAISAESVCIREHIDKLRINAAEADRLDAAMIAALKGK